MDLKLQHENTTGRGHMVSQLYPVPPLGLDHCQGSELEGGHPSSFLRAFSQSAVLLPAGGLIGLDPLYSACPQTLAATNRQRSGRKENLLLDQMWQWGDG